MKFIWLVGNGAGREFFLKAFVTVSNSNSSRRRRNCKGKSMGCISGLKRQTWLLVNIHLRRNSGSGSSWKKLLLGLIHELWFISRRICVGFWLDSGQYLHFSSPLEFEWESSVCSYIVLVSMASFSNVHKKEEIVTFFFFYFFSSTASLLYFTSLLSADHCSVGNWLLQVATGLFMMMLNRLIKCSWKACYSCILTISRGRNIPSLSYW